MTEDKFCINCKWYSPPSYSPMWSTLSMCSYPKSTKNSDWYLVTGQERKIHKCDPFENRRCEELCGEKGKWYDPKSST